jgi:integrase
MRSINGYKMTHKLHITKAKGRWYVYAFRGGPRIAIFNERPVISPDLVALGERARKEAQSAPDSIMRGLIDAYRASPEFERLSPSSQRDYARSLQRIGDRFGNAPLAVFDDRRMRGQVIQWRDGWRDQPRTADKLTVMFGTLLQWGLERGRVGINIAHGIPLLHHADRSESIWTDAHWEAIRPHASKELWSALQLASLTGLRLGDLVKLDWSHVGERAIVIITAKRKKRVAIPILPDLRRFLDELPKGGTVLKNSRGQSWTSSGLGGIFQKAKAKAGLDVTIHDLRGTFVTWLAVKGLTDEEIARIVGWAPKQVANVRHRYVDEARVVVSLVERLSKNNA